MGGVSFAEENDAVSGNDISTATSFAKHTYTSYYDGLSLRTEKNISFPIDVPYQDNDLSALIMYGIGRDYVLKNYQSLQQTWSEEGLSTTIQQNCIVEMFQFELA